MSEEKLFLDEVKTFHAPIKEIDPSEGRETKEKEAYQKLLEQDARVLTDSARRLREVTPREIRARREKVTLQILVQKILKDTLHEGYPVSHLWWPNKRAPWKYELRKGNPPADQDRPHHLRGQDLHIDPLPGGQVPYEAIRKIMLAVKQHKKRPGREQQLSPAAQAIQDQIKSSPIWMPHK